MSEITLDEREKQLVELNDFNKSISQEIANITSTLGWTVESISNDVYKIAIILLRFIYRIKVIINRSLFFSRIKIS